jgi:hypothetical protein
LVIIYENPHAADYRKISAGVSSIPTRKLSQKVKRIDYTQSSLSSNEQKKEGYSKASGQFRSKLQRSKIFQVY